MSEGKNKIRDEESPLMLMMMIGEAFCFFFCKTDKLG